MHIYFAKKFGYFNNDIYIFSFTFTCSIDNKRQIYIKVLVKIGVLEFLLAK